MMHNNSCQIIETGVVIAVPCGRQVPQQVGAHVEAIQRELDERVHLSPCQV